MPAYLNAVAGHRDPATISVQPGDVVLAGLGRTERTILAVLADEVYLLDGTPMPLADVTLVRPAGLTPEELSRELLDEAYEKTERALYDEVVMRLPPDTTPEEREAEYLARKAAGADLPPPPDRAALLADPRSTGREG